MHGQTGILGQFALRYAHYCRMNLISNGAIRRTGGRFPCRSLPPPTNETPSAHRPRLKMIDTARDQLQPLQTRPTPGRKRSVSPLLRHALWRRVGGRETQGTPRYLVGAGAALARQTVARWFALQSLGKAARSCRRRVGWWSWVGSVTCLYGRTVGRTLKRCTVGSGIAPASGRCCSAAASSGRAASARATDSR